MAKIWKHTGSDPTVHCTNNPGTAHVCIKCGGQITIALVADAGVAGSSAGDLVANIDYVVLQPAAWGRFKGLNARKDVADTLATMGVKAIRLGGSFCSVRQLDCTWTNLPIFVYFVRFILFLGSRIFVFFLPVFLFYFSF